MSENEIDRRLRLALLGDPRYQSIEMVWFAWRPVRLQGGGWAWGRFVRRFKPLGLFWEFYEL